MLRNHARCQLQLGNIVPLLVALTLLSATGTLALFVPAANAANGQCKWEGGAGDPTYPSCKDEDCIEDGGRAQCVAPSTKPNNGLTSADVDGDNWRYFMCREVAPNVPDYRGWCMAAGGTYSGGTCTGAGAGYNAGGSSANQESLALASVSAYGPIVWPGCGWTASGDSQWGLTSTSQQCWSGAPLVKNGLIYRDYRYMARSLGQACGGSAIQFYLLRTRQVVCPVGAESRTKPNGDLDCVIPAEACCMTRGNPVVVLTGAKIEEAVDYRGQGAAALSFVRYYNSQGYFEPRSVAGRPVTNDDVWRHSYQRRLFPVTGNPNLSAILQLADGSLRHFDSAGYEILKRNGSTSRLTFTSGVGWTLYLPDLAQERYDTSGRLTSLVGPTGFTTSLTYGPGGKLTTVQDHFGRQLQLAYDTDGRLTSMTNPAGGVTSYQYGVGLPSSSVRDPLNFISHPDTTTTTYLYEGGNDVSRLTGVVDESGQQVSTFVYSASSGKVLSTERAGGVFKYSFSYGSSTGNPTSVTDPLGLARAYYFSKVGGVHRFSDMGGVAADGAEKALFYDAAGNVIRRDFFPLNRATYAYDLTRNLEISRTEGLNSSGGSTSATRTITTAWHPTLRLPSQITEPSGVTGVNRVTNFTYDGQGNQLTKTVTAGAISRTWTRTYDALGRVLTEDGPRTNVTDTTSYTYFSDFDPCLGCRGQVQTVTNALGHVTTYTAYDVHGRPTRIADVNGVVTDLVYDTRQRLTQSTVGYGTASPEVTTYEYYPFGQLKKLTLPDTSYVLYSYDAVRRLTQFEDGLGNKNTYTLDNYGNVTGENASDGTATLRRTLTRVFDYKGRLEKLVGAAGTAAVTTTYGYDANGRDVTSIAAPLARTTTNTYDTLNRLTVVKDPALKNTTFTYDAADNLKTVTDPRNLVTSYTYNGLGDLTQQVSPDTGTSTFTPDSAGNRGTATDARSKTGTYVYDALNRVTSITFPGETVSYTYDQGTNGKGRLTSVVNGTVATSYAYDTKGRVSGKGLTVGSQVLSVGYGYGYANGRLASLVLPSGRTVNYSYTNGRITSINMNGTTLLSGVQYQPFGPVASWSWGSGALMTRTYDLDGRPSAIASAGNRGYTYDDASRITSITDSLNSSLSWTYGYDVMDRLTSASRTGLSQTWTYDNDGNRLTQGGSTSTTFTPATTSNRLSSTAGALARTYGYDAAGNSPSYGTNSFTYSDPGRMASVTNAGVTTSYLYNGLGQRVKKTVPSGARYFVYDEAGHLVGTYDATGALVEEFVWLDDVPVASLRPNGVNTTILYIHADHLNTPIKLTRATDNVVVWRWDRDPFGTAVPTEDPDGDAQPVTQNLRFPGQYADAESGLSYNYFRDYDSAIGRYVESDPLGLRGGLNTYSYAGANPVMLFDEDGTNPVAAARGGYALGGIANAGINAALVRATGATLGVLIYEMCHESEEDKLRKRCQALKDSILKTCY